jgi:hypothetical protein
METATKRQGQNHGQPQGEEEVQIFNWPTNVVVQGPQQIQQPPQGWQPTVHYVNAGPMVNIGSGDNAPAYYSYAQNTSNWANEVELASRNSDPLGLGRDIEMANSSTQDNGNDPAPVAPTPPTTVMSYSTQPNVSTTTPVVQPNTVNSVQTPTVTPVSEPATMPPPGMIAYRKKPLKEHNPPAKAPRSSS